MGVTLERVQNKFACIIGELCSEPLILSQFAIWVDLRIAEYKAKGAISLEISGEEPDPIWLKGHKPSPPSAHKGNLIPDMYDPTGGGDSNFDSVNMHMGSCDDRLSPDVVVVKAELDDSDTGSIFPISLHGNSSLYVGLTHSRFDGLKRPHTDTLSSDSNLHRSSMSSSPSKIHRPSASSSHTAPTNQSLMSIISDRDDSPQVYETSENQSSTHATSPSKGDNFLSSFVVSDTAESSLPSSSNTRVPDPSASDSTDCPAVQESGSVHRGSRNLCEPQSLTVSQAELHHMYPREIPDWLSNTNIRTSIKYSESKTSGIISETVKIVGILRRWLWSKYREIRELQNIPPEELDLYLAEFFPKLRTLDGLNFDPRFLTNLRSTLARYLVEHGYSHSITKSPLFMKSCVSFSVKRKALSSKI